jgi:hypothetical protein
LGYFWTSLHGTTETVESPNSGHVGGVKARSQSPKELRESFLMCRFGRERKGAISVANHKGGGRKKGGKEFPGFLMKDFFAALRRLT